MFFYQKYDSAVISKMFISVEKKIRPTETYFTDFVATKPISWRLEGKKRLKKVSIT